ncbi:MAG: phosphate transport system permease protein [Archaeoglobi archaeon]|nr:phosphate transport system permease protein [Archaeoglobi archaeon]MDK2781606.1 phosphate transport system permease protein [Archaeoglobi archaeon]
MKSIMERAFEILAITATVFGVVVLSVLVTYTFLEALGWLDWQFLTSPPSRFPEKAGIYPSLVGSIMAIALVGLLSIPLGVGTAIFLEEYAEKRRIAKIIEVNISNLAAVPSIVYGLLGLGLFVSTLHLKPGIVLVGSLTLTLLILPTVTVAAQEALRAVPGSIREASFAVGATKWQTVRNAVLPSALPGILTGLILALSRAIGETAPLIMIGAATTIFSPPKSIFSTYSPMPMQIFMWTDMPREEFLHGLAPAGVIVLLAVMLSMNALAVYLRNRFEKRLRG